MFNILTYEEARALQIKDVILFLKGSNRSKTKIIGVDVNKILRLYINNMFCTYIYFSDNFEISNEYKIHIYENNIITGQSNIINPKSDNRFLNRSWKSLFKNDPRSAATINLNDLLDIIKHLGRLSNMKIFM